ncbi:MAG: DUF5110 domain-containing protein [Cyclobacteriaceae bacterium]|nr:DUF5110 domain-containing protein [Cyclobacteriaceae bacterium]
MNHFRVISAFGILLFLSGYQSFANNDRTYIRHVYTQFNLNVETSDGAFRIRPLSARAMEVFFFDKHQDHVDTISHALSLKPSISETRFMEYPDRLEYSAGDLKAIVNKSPFRIAFYHRGQLLSREASGYFKDGSYMGYSFELDQKEELFGGGMRALGMNHRGERLELNNKAHFGYETHAPLMNYGIPMVISSRNYAILFDNAGKGFIDIGATEKEILRFSSLSGRMSYVFISADTPAELIREYTGITGRQPIPPRWVLGNFASRFGYRNQKEVEATCNLFNRYAIPLDALVIDLYWFGPDIQGHMGNLDWDRNTFPRPEAMMKTLAEDDVHTVLITEPFILTSSKRWSEALEKDILAKDSTGGPGIFNFYFGESGIIDIFKPEARKWFWDIYKRHTQSGVGGWWGDLGEPEAHPDHLIYSAGKAPALHNIYGHNWARLIHEGYQADFPGRRPFILMRSGFAGSQRFGLIPWSGDVARSWGGLQSQPVISLQMGMQGLGYMHSDLGGFGGGELFDPELYIRWLQYGVFQPVFRPHAQEHIAPEPVYHDARTMEQARKQILLRYSMLPYNYTLAYENSSQGLPLMRPLYMLEPGNPALFSYSTAYSWGNDFVVSPILESGKKEQEVYLPEGSNWYHFYNRGLYTGGKSYNITLSEDHIPVFVRAGAVIPLTRPYMRSRHYSSDSMQVHIYRHPSVEKGQGYFYHDDGESTDAWEKEAFEKVVFSYSEKEGALEITAERTGNDYNGRPESRFLHFQLHHSQKRPSKINVDGIKLVKWKKQEPFKTNGYVYDKENEILHVFLTWVGKNQKIEIR